MAYIEGSGSINSIQYVLIFHESSCYLCWFFSFWLLCYQMLLMVTICITWILDDILPTLDTKTQLLILSLWKCTNHIKRMPVFFMSKHWKWIIVLHKVKMQFPYNLSLNLMPLVMEIDVLVNLTTRNGRTFE